MPEERIVRAGFWTYGRVALTALAVVGLLVVAATCGRDAPTEKPVEKAAEPLPPAVLDAQLWDLQGKVFRLSDYRGRVVVLDVWATWCGPCREEIPHLNELSREYAGRGVEVVGMTVEDASTDYAAVRDFARDFPVGYRVGWAQPEWTTKLLGDNDAIPQTFVIGRDGRTYLHATGFYDDTVRLLRDAIERALAES